MPSPLPATDILDTNLGDLLRSKPQIRLTLLAEYTNKPLGHFLATCKRKKIGAQEGGKTLITQLEDIFKGLGVTWP